MVVKYFENFIDRERIGFKNLAAASDFLRYIILFFEGGYYIDTDIGVSSAGDNKGKFFREEKLLGGFKANIEFPECTIFSKNYSEDELRNLELEGDVSNDFIAATPEHLIIKNTLIIALKGYRELYATPIQDSKCLELSKNLTQMDAKRWPYSEAGNKSHSIGRLGLTIEGAGPSCLTRGINQFLKVYSNAETDSKEYKQMLMTMSMSTREYHHPLKIGDVDLDKECDLTWLKIPKNRRAFSTDSLSLSQQSYFHPKTSDDKVSVSSKIGEEKKPADEFLKASFYLPTGPSPDPLEAQPKKCVIL